MPMSHVHHHGAHFLDDQRLGTLSEPGAHFADLSDLQSEIGKPMNKGLKGLSASVPDLTGKSFGIGRQVVGPKGEKWTVCRKCVVHLKVDGS